MNTEKTKHTPGPWQIDWYNCTMDEKDVKHAKSNGNLNAKIGDVMWRAPNSIGPCGIEHSHWGGNLLTVGEADAYLIAAAPELLAELRQCVEIMVRAVGERIPVQIGTHCEESDWVTTLRKARAAISKAEGVK